MGGGKEGGSWGYWCYCKDWATNKCKKNGGYNSYYNINSDISKHCVGDRGDVMENEGGGGFERGWWC